VGLRFNPPPNWPPPPPGFVPPPRWQPDPDWPPPPPGWQLWVPDDAGPGRPGDFPGGAAGVPPRPPEFAAGPAGAATQVTGPARPPWHDDFATGAGEFPPGPGGFQGGPGGFQGGPGDLQGGPGDLQGGPGDFQGGPPAPSGQTNGFAVAAFVLGLLGIGTVLSYVFGVVALRQIRVSGQRGRGLAIAGLALSAMWTLLVIAFVLLNSKTPPAKTPVAGGSTPTASSSSPAPSPVPSGSAGTANVFSLVTGECFQNPPASQTVLGITYVTVTPCTKRHNAQVFVEFPATGTRYPGSAALQREADQGCHKRVSRTIVKSKITPTMTLRYLYPLAGSWAQGHRTISCLIVDAKPDLKTSLLRHAPKH
jgi:Domain of unknown function (DUF4190)